MIIYMCTRINIYVCMYVYVPIYIHSATMMTHDRRINIYIHTYICIWIYIYIYTYTYIYPFIYIYTYIYTHTHIYIFVYIYIHIYIHIIHVFATPPRRILTLDLCHSDFSLLNPFLDWYCSSVQGLLDWFEVDLGFTELLFIQIDLCVMCVFVLYSPVSLSSCLFFGHPALPTPRGGSASRVSP